MASSPSTTPDRNARIAKLPKWAQEELRSLERDLGVALDELEDLREGKYGDADTDTVADPYADAPLKLKKGETIEYRLGYDRGAVIRARVDQYGILELNGGQAIAVHPRAANAVHVALLDR